MLFTVVLLEYQKIILIYMFHIIKDGRIFNHIILVFDTITIFFVGKFTM